MRRRGYAAAIGAHSPRTILTDRDWKWRPFDGRQREMDERLTGLTMVPRIDEDRTTNAHLS